MYLSLQQRYDFQCRGKIDIKGKGKMTTYFLIGRRSPSGYSVSSYTQGIQWRGISQDSMSAVPMHLRNQAARNSFQEHLASIKVNIVSLRPFCSRSWINFIYLSVGKIILKLCKSMTESSFK